MASLDFGAVWHFYDSLDSTVVNVAFQTLRREFGATLTTAEW